MKPETTQGILNWLMDVAVAITFISSGGIFALSETLCGEATAFILMLAGFGFLSLNRKWRKVEK